MALSSWGGGGVTSHVSLLAGSDQLFRAVVLQLEA
jgi:hypothetical protein